MEDYLLFEYSYIEREQWECGSLNVKTGEFHSNKVGWSYFSGGVHAVEVLREFYTVSPGIATINGDILSDAPVIGWLNHLFGESWTNRRFLTLLKTCCVEPDWEITGDLPHALKKISNLDIDANRELFRLLRNRKETALEALTVMDNPLFPIPTILRKLHTLHTDLGSYQKDGGTSSDLLRVLKSTESDLQNLSEIENSIWNAAQDIPAELIQPEIEQIFHLEGTPEEDLLRSALESISAESPMLSLDGEFGLSDRGLAFYEALLETVTESPVYEIDTACFLAGCSFYYSNRSPYPKWDYQIICNLMIPWWKPEGEIKLSESLLSWMKDIRIRLEKAIAEGTHVSAAKVMPWLGRIGAKAYNVFRYPFFFRSMWLDFQENAESEAYQAAIRVMEDILQECMADPERNLKSKSLPLYQYCALLANRELRKEQLGF